MNDHDIHLMRMELDKLDQKSELLRLAEQLLIAYEKQDALHQAEIKQIEDNHYRAQRVSDETCDDLQGEADYLQEKLDTMQVEIERLKAELASSEARYILMQEDALATIAGLHTDIKRLRANLSAAAALCVEWEKFRLAAVSVKARPSPETRIVSDAAYESVSSAFYAVARRGGPEKWVQKEDE